MRVWDLVGGGSGGGGGLPARDALAVDVVQVDVAYSRVHLIKERLAQRRRVGESTKGAAGRGRAAHGSRVWRRGSAWQPVEGAGSVKSHCAVICALSFGATKAVPSRKVVS